MGYTLNYLNINKIRGLNLSKNLLHCSKKWCFVVGVNDTSYDTLSLKMIQNGTF